ncbi:MAG: PAS domain S-box protein, partial [Desulfuromonadaceae bacterium]|nr:PAS domain S-box protein [Desulfuromonadaceae bacterium]
MMSKCRHILKYLLHLAPVFSLFLLITQVTPVYAAAKVPQILVLNSYNMGYDWSEDEMKGVRSGFSRLFPRVDFFIEHLDTKKFHYKLHFPKLADLLESKYSTRKIDVIVAMDNAALEFATRYRKRISPGTPLVFCGINDYKPSMIAGETAISGVAENHDFIGTLKMALQLHPESRDVTVIHDFTDTGIAIRQELIEIANRLPGIKLHFMDEMPLEETIQKLKLIPSDYLVLMLSYTVEKGGRTFSHSEAARLVSGASPVPVYSVYAEQLGSGVVGGQMMKGETQGLKAAEIASRIIAGEPPEKIPVFTSDLSQPSFDYSAMKRFGIRPAALPPDVVLINKPPSTFAINKKIVWTVSLITLFSAVGMTVLIINIRKRKLSEKMLCRKIEEYQESQEELQQVEEMLRSQVDEYMQTQDELQATDEMLREQIEEHLKTHDQLLATEEMLRVQLAVTEESSQKFKAVFEYSPITVVLTTLPEGTFCEVNQTFIDMFGYTREEAVGKTTLELGVWQQESDRNDYISLMKSDIHVHNFEAEMLRKSGERFTVLISGAFLEIDGKPSLLSAIMDVTEQRRLQGQLHQSQKMDVVGQLAGGIAHDFNNMLAGIMAAAELLKMRLPGDVKNGKMVETIIEATKRSADLIRELLTFSRKGNSLLETVNVHETITAVMTLLERTIDKRIKLIGKFEDGDPLVMGDHTQLQNAL